MFHRTANKICAEWLEQAWGVLYNKEKRSKAISCKKEKGFLNGKRNELADELEEPVDEVRKIYEAVMKAAPDYDMKMICESLA